MAVATDLATQAVTGEKNAQRLVPRGEETTATDVESELSGPSGNNSIRSIRGHDPESGKFHPIPGTRTEVQKGRT